MVRLIGSIPPWPAIRGVIGLLIIGFVIIALIHVDRFVGSLKPYHFTRVELVDHPQWCPNQLVQRLLGVPDDLMGASLYDLKLPARVAAAYQANPWVRNVVYVRKRFPDTLLVKLEVRRPQYAVEKAGRYTVVDREGCVSEAKFKEWSETISPLLIVWGVKTTPAQPGRWWSDTGLMGGIEVLEAIAAQGSLIDRAGIQGVDVSNLNGAKDKNASDIAVIARNFRIAWGRPPSTPRFGERTVAEKLDLLEKLLKVNPQPRDIELNARFAGAGGGVIMLNSGKAIR